MDSITCPVARWADKAPNAPAVIAGSSVIAYSQLHRRIISADNHLAGVGIERGTRVAVLLSNTLDSVIALLALTRLGAVAALVSTRLPDEAIPGLITKLGCNFLLHDRTLSSSIPSVTQINVASFTSAIGGKSSSDGAIPLESPAVAVFTSGSSGEPKAALLSYGNLYFNALGSNENITVGPGERWLLSLPLYHVGGLGILFRTILAGGTVVIPDRGANLASAIASHNISHISVVTTQLHRLLEDRAQLKDLGSLRAILIGGSMVPRSLISRSIEAELPIFTSYGLTEMASQVTTTAPGDPIDRLLTSGRLLPHGQLLILSDGEMFVTGQTRFQGYLTNSVLETPFDHNGWFGTGDLGTLDQKGYLSVTGRKDNRFVSGGENIQPEEIERALLENQMIEEAVVVPIENDEYGFRPVAFVKPSPGSVLNQGSLERQLRERLPRFKIPDRILPWPTKLINSGIKPSRAQLQKLARKAVS